MGQLSTDIELLQASRAGGLEAFGALVERYQSLVCGVCWSATGSRALSEDLAQETFLIAWSSLHTLKDTGRFRAWLCSIARHLCAKARRKTRREVPLESETTELEQGRTPLEAVLQQEQTELLWSALAQVPPRYREPLVLFYQEGHTAAEVAGLLDLSESAVHQRLSRGRRYLKAQVFELVEDTLSQKPKRRGFVAAVLAACAAAPAGAHAAPKAGDSSMFLKLLVPLSLTAAVAVVWQSQRQIPKAQGPSTQASPLATNQALRKAKVPGSRALVFPETVRKDKAVAVKKFARRYRLLGIEKKWAEGALAESLMPCFEGGFSSEIHKVVLGLKIEAKTLTEAELLEPKELFGARGYERCVVENLSDYAMQLEPAGQPQLVMETSERREHPPLQEGIFEALDLQSAPFKGPQSAAVTMVVFSDFHCHFCGKLLGTIDQLMEDYPDSLKVIVRPIALRPKGELATQAAYAAQAQDKFWPMHDLLFANQSELSKANILEYAHRAGLDMERFEADLRTGTFKEQVKLEREESKAMGVMAMPTIVLGEERILGARDIEVYREKIQRLLKR